MVKRAGLSLSSAVRQEKLPLCEGKFTLTGTGVSVKGRPSLEEFGIAWRFSKWSERSSPWWVVGLLDYAETRRDWAEVLDSVIDFTGYSPGRVASIRSIWRSIPESRRREDVSFSVHEAVAGLDPDEQDEILEQAATESLSVREVKTIIRTKRRRAVIEGQASLEGQFRVIYADPPWAYNDRGDITVGKSSAYKRAEAHYPTMTIADICALPVKAHAMPNAVLLMWVTAPLLYQNPGPREVGEAWGFSYKENVIWDKVLGNFGHYCRVRHEHLTIWTRGDGLPDGDANWLDSVQTFRRGEHSAKPAEFYGIIEKLYPTGPYVELFARERRTGWSAFGNDAKLWAAS